MCAFNKKGRGECPHGLVSAAVYAMLPASGRTTPLELDVEHCTCFEHSPAHHFYLLSKLQIGCLSIPFFPRRVKFSASKVGASCPGKPRETFCNWGDDVGKFWLSGSHPSHLAPSRGLRLQSPLAGLAGTALAVSQVKAAVFNGRPYRGQRPLAAPSVRRWKSHKTPGNWTLRASFAKPPRGAAINRRRRFRR